MCPPWGLIQTSFGEPERISKNRSSIGTCVSRMPLMTSMGAEGLSSQPAVLRDNKREQGSLHSGLRGFSADHSPFAFRLAGRWSNVDLAFTARLAFLLIGEIMPVHFTHLARGSQAQDDIRIRCEANALRRPHFSPAQVDVLIGIPALGVGHVALHLEGGKEFFKRL